ncbi:MAG: tetratricopeptide repeat protein [Nitrospinales bacterium]
MNRHSARGTGRFKQRSGGVVGAAWFFFLTMLLLFPVRSFAETLRSRIDAGISHYKNGEYEKAAQRFLEAQVDEPDNAVLTYDLANSNYKAGKFAEAIQAYGRAAARADDPALQQKAFYNIGNSLFRLGKLEEAAGAYKKALELNPGDMDAKFNLEFTREQIKKRQQQQKQNRNKQNQKQSSSGNKGQDKQPQSNADKQKRKSPENQDRAGQNPEKPKNRDKQTPPQNSGAAQAQPQNGEMTPQEAKQWLRSLKENPKKFIQGQIMKHAANPQYRGKDW